MKPIPAGLLVLALAGCNTTGHKTHISTGDVVAYATTYEASPHMAATHSEQVKYYKRLTQAANIARHAPGTSGNGTARRVWTTVHKHYNKVGHILAGQGESTRGFSFDPDEWRAAWQALGEDKCIEVSKGYENAYRGLAAHLGQRSRWSHLAPKVSGWADTERRRQEHRC